jgi:hypothetical protein
MAIVSRNDDFLQQWGNVWQLHQPESPLIVAVLVFLGLRLQHPLLSSLSEFDSNRIILALIAEWSSDPKSKPCVSSSCVVAVAAAIAFPNNRNLPNPSQIVVCCCVFFFDGFRDPVSSASESESKPRLEFFVLDSYEGKRRNGSLARGISWLRIIY